MEQTFSEMVRVAKKVVITSHTSPDLDAVGSSLLLTETLRANFSGPEFRHVLEEHPAGDLSFINGFETIEFLPMFATLESYKPDLLIIVDANNFQRISRNESESVREWIKVNNTKTIVIDHHEETTKDAVDLFLNEHGPAAVQEVYRLCFTKLGLKKPEGYGDMVMLGLLGDTGRFKYANPAHRETFAIVDELIDNGVSIERIDDKLQRYTPAQLKVLAELMNNLSAKDGYSFAYISDEFRDTWLADKMPVEDFKLACGLFVDQYIRNIEDREWGFAAYPDLLNTVNYTGSFRASNGTRDVAAIANLLGGGGHKPAAGAKFPAKNMGDALLKIHEAIKLAK